MKRALTICALMVAAACGEQGAATPNAAVMSPDGERRFAISWSPDGARLAWWAPSSDSTPDWQLWAGNADFSAPVKLLDGLTAPVVWSADGKQILASSSQFGVGNVAIVPSTGGEVRRLTNGAGVESPMAWHRDGDRFAYSATVEGGTLRTMVGSVRGAKPTSLVPSEARPVLGFWSPDGSHVGYMRLDGPKQTIWVADSAGANPRQLTTEGFEQFSNQGQVPAFFSASPWSPDGKELLYESRRTGTSDLWVVPIDGGKPRQLTRDVRNDYSGAWSSDGKSVAFISDRGRQVDVWVVPSAGGVEQRVTDSPAEESETQWRPKTKELSFVTTTRKSSVWALDIADGKERRLTLDSITSSWLTGSPDGKQVALVIERGGGIQDLAVIPVAGGPMRLLVTGGSVYGPYWSPDGSRIVYQSDRGGTWDVWVVDVAGGPPRQLENWPGYEWAAHWSGDGAWIYFCSDRDSKLGDIWKVAPTGGEPVRVTKNGTVGDIGTRAGAANLFALTINPRGGQLAIDRLRPDGTLAAVWDRSNAGWLAFSASGDSIIAVVQQPDGKKANMILPASGGPGRVILGANEMAADWSRDGKSVLYILPSNGANDLGILNLADGSKRRLTTTPESEQGAEFTPDGKTVIVRRMQMVQRIVRMDLSKLLAGGK